MVSASFTIHRDGRVAGWDAAAETTFELRAEDVLGFRLPAALHEQLNPLLELALETGNPVSRRLQIDCGIKGISELHVSAAPLAQAGGSADSVLFLAVEFTGPDDLCKATHLNSAEEERQLRTAIYRAMYERFPLPTYVWQRGQDDFLLTDFNRAAEQVTRGGVARWIGTKLHASHADEPEIIRDVERCYAEQSVIQREMSYSYRSVDERRDLRVTYGFVPPDTVVVNTEDVTERRKVEERQRVSQRLEAIGQLAGGVAHDFNNLLLVINSNVEFVLEALPENDATRPDVLEIRRAGRQAAALTQQLLAFSRRQILEPKVLNLNDVVDSSLKMLRRLLREDIQIETRRAPDLGNVRADRGQLEQIIVNLAVNARDAMPQGGVLTIETTNVELISCGLAQDEVAPGPYVRLSVTDTGIGMDDETRQRVFEPFFTTKEVGQGTGLGLPTVYGIVRQSGGTIAVHSEPGQGSSFVVHFPRIDDAAPSSCRTLAPLPAASQVTVLLVEDDLAVRDVAERILRHAGYGVIAAESGKEALELTMDQQEPPRLLITDVVMPQMSGRQVAEELRGRFPAMRVLYMSGYTDNAIVHHGVLDKGTHFIGKPFTASGLTRKVREVLASEPGSTQE